MKKAIQLFLLVCCLGQYASAQNSAIVLFDYDKFLLTDHAKSKLDEVVSKLDRNQLKLVELNGNTDADGHSKYNIMLSKNRANEVRDYLITKGIPAEKIQLKFDGENKPVAENASETGKQQNRRVEITFAFFEKEYTNTIFSLFEKDTQTFAGKSNEIITITGKQGTKITIPKNALLKANGKYAVGKIDIELQEFYKKSDAITANLHTMSGAEMLESGGMIHIKASSNGEELKLKKNAKMTIEFASPNAEGMQTFYGYPQKNKSINWNTDENRTGADPNIEPDPMTSGSVSTRYSTYVNKVLVSEVTTVDTISFNRGYETKKYGRTKGETQMTNFVGNTILKSAKLGWINCDRFYQVRDKTDLIVDIDLKYKPEIRLIFKDINSIMPGYVDVNNKVIFKGVPSGKKATVIAFSAMDDQVYFGIKEINIEKDATVGLAQNSITPEEFKTALQQLN